MLREYGVSQMPVVKPGAGHPDVMAAEVVGSVVERELLDALFSKRASLEDPLEKHMCAPLPTRRSSSSRASRPVWSAGRTCWRFSPRAASSSERAVNWPWRRGTYGFPSEWWTSRKWYERVTSAQHTLNTGPAD